MQRMVLAFLVAILATFSLNAAEITLSGNFEYGFITNKKDAMTETVAESETTLSALVSDFVTLDTTFVINPDAAVLDDLSVTADVGAWFGLPIGYVVAVSAFGNADNDVDFNILHLDCDFDFNPANKQIYFGAVVTPEPISIKGYYDSNGVDMDDGLVGGNLGLVVDPASFSGGLEYDLFEKDYSYDTSVYLTLAPIGVGVSLEGSKASPVELICIDLDYIDYAGLDLACTVNQEEDAALRGIDFSTYISIDAIDFRLGYLVTEFGEGDENAPAAPLNGGVYAKMEVSY